MTRRGTHGGTGTAGGPPRHVPVLLSSALQALDPKNHDRYIDATFGAGGYTSAVLEFADCKVLGLDRDPDAIAAGQELVAHYAGRLTLVEGRFGAMKSLAEAHGFSEVDGIVMDIGVSSMHLDQAGRGFSFQADGPLDMRMSKAGPTAADVVNTLKSADLADVIYRLGEERRSRAIAKAIVNARQNQPISRTLELAGIVETVLGRKPGQDRHPATRTFQALRLYVNRELEELANGLHAAEQLLKPGGKLVVVTFHSLEDRIVKRFFATRTGHTARPSRHLPEATGELQAPGFRYPDIREVTPARAEIEQNPRARSARLRAGIRLSAPAVHLDSAALGLPFVPLFPSL